jgi:5-carboxymethyl-2-hydroxymuconate isomerase
MPHLVLEYSDNLSQAVDWQQLLLDLHGVVAETAGVDVGACKGRALPQATFLVGRGGASTAFVHLELRLLAGRTPDEKRVVSAACMDVLARHLARPLEAFDLQLTVEVRDMEPGSYQKRTGSQDFDTAGAAIVVDTNSFVAAAFNPDSDSARILDAVRAGELRLVWDEATRQETSRIVNKIPPISWDHFADLFHDEERYAGETHPGRYEYVSDPDDRKFLALAEATGATLITQDAHLLTGRARAAVPVVTPGEFWARR